MDSAPAVPDGRADNPAGKSMIELRSVCLFCSSGDALPDTARAIAAEFGAACAAHHFRLVYGGSGRGLMGIAARAAVAAGGEVLGIMPRHLLRPEAAAPGLGRLEVVDTLAERKQRMADASGVFVALPGGIGTLDELLEMLTLNDLGLQDKPVILCSSDGFWRPFTALMDGLAAYGTLRPRSTPRFQVTESVTDAVRRIEAHFGSRRPLPGEPPIRHGV
jgi:uncharacterized protein (TIGR00730 family)